MIPNRSRLLRSAWLLAATLAAMALFPGGASARAAPAGAEPQIALGAYIPNFSQRPGLIDEYGRRVGRQPVIVGSYKQWSSRPFVRAELRAVWNRGAVPMVTWEPWSYAGRRFPLRAIADGSYDGYVRRAARAAAAWGKPILLRFAHEMNGNWYPWGRGVNGNTPRIYKAAWRHLVRIFRSYGANNVKWVWTPNVNGSGRYPFKQLYPGDRWVNWVGLDGFNWARRGEWQSFTDIFGSSYDSLLHMTSRPMIIGETGSNESGGNKAAWVSSALNQELPQFSRIRAVGWFNAPFDRSVDFRVNSSPASLRAFRSAIASPRYGLTRSALLSTPANLRQRSAAPSAPSGGFGQPSLFYRITQKLHGRYLWIAVALCAGALLILALVIGFVRKTLRARAAR
jgi:hypothetical protein